MKLTRIEIPKRQDNCSASQHLFKGGDQCFTFLYQENEKWKRQDLCEECWHSLKAKGLPANTKTYWQVKIPEKTPKELTFKHKEEKALHLLKKALSDSTTTSHCEAFVLALYLARKKQLQLRQELDQLGEQVYLFEVLATEELLAVKKMHLTVEEIKILQNKIALILGTAK